MAEDRKSELGDRLQNRMDSLSAHQKKLRDDISALNNQIYDMETTFLNEYSGTSHIFGGRSFGPHENRIFSSSDSQAGSCEKLPKGIEEEEIRPDTTTASAHAPPPGTTRKNQSSASKQKKIWSSLTADVTQAGGCEKLPKGIEEEETEPKAIAAPGHARPPRIPPRRTTRSQSSAGKQKGISSSLTSPVSQAGRCEKLTKGIEEEEIMPKATGAPAPQPGTTTESWSSASKEKKIRKY